MLTAMAASVTTCSKHKWSQLQKSMQRGSAGGLSLTAARASATRAVLGDIRLAGEETLDGGGYTYRSCQLHSLPKSKKRSLLT